MWHDAWPPLPPGGHQPADAPPFTSPGDQLLAVGVGAAAGAGALAWATGQAAGLAFGHTWLERRAWHLAHAAEGPTNKSRPSWSGRRPSRCDARVRPPRPPRWLEPPS
jgi:hypothetical protein